MTGSITAIVPTYNRAGYLAEAVAAIAGQTRPPLEIIVWDDGSTDSTPEAVRTLPGPVRAFRTPNGGKSRALNAALQEARGEYVWICDDDDIARPDAAERLGAMLDDAEAGVAGGSYVRFRDDPATGARTVTDAGYWPDLSEGSVLRHLLEDIFLFQNATLVRRDLYDRVGPFREDLPRSIDYDMIVRLAARSPVAMTEAVLFEQRKHEGVRGPARAQHAAGDVERVWLANDRRVFEGLRPVLPLSLYAAMFEAPTRALAERAGLLQRATVYARRDDWAAAIEDLEAAAELTAAGPLTRAEWAICRRALAGKHAVSIGLSPAVTTRLAALRRRNALGRTICRAYARGVLWRARRALQRGERTMALRAFRFGTIVGGTEFLVKGPLNEPNLPCTLKERRILPLESYFW